MDGNNNLNWQAFLSMYDPKYSLHLLEGSSSLPNFSVTASTTSLPVQNNEEDVMSHSPSVASVTTQERASAELRRMWQAAIRACQRADTAHMGTVPRDVFMAIMQDCVGKVVFLNACSIFDNIYAVYVKRCHQETRRYLLQSRRRISRLQYVFPPLP